MLRIQMLKKQTVAGFYRKRNEIDCLSSLDGDKNICLSDKMVFDCFIKPE